MPRRFKLLAWIVSFENNCSATRRDNGVEKESGGEQRNTSFLFVTYVIPVLGTLSFGYNGQFLTTVKISDHKETTHRLHLQRIPYGKKTDLIRSQF
jgi:hypothetical protein